MPDGTASLPRSADVPVFELALFKLILNRYYYK